MRDRFTLTVEHNTAEDLRLLSKVTRISISRLIDEAVEDLVDKYDLPALAAQYEEKERIREEKRAKK